MTDVMARVKAHYKRAVEHYGAAAVLGVFHYGSWNYGTNLPDSDVDTKCILIPDLYSLAIKPYEVKHLAVDDEVCECMSIMHMVSNWKKQNINFVEILFTKYCIINPLYQDVWHEWMNEDNREAIARYDIKAAVLSMAYQAIHTIKQDPTDLKKKMNGARIANSLSALIAEPRRSYAEVIRANEKIAKIRTGETPFSENCVEGLFIAFDEFIARANNGDYNNKNMYLKSHIDCFLNSFIMAAIEHRINAL